MSRSERDLVSALRAELAAINPSRPCDRRAEAAGLGSASPRREGPVARLAIRLGRGGRAATGPDDAFDWATAAEHCRLAYLRGLFLARGSLSLASGRTHLEFVVDPEWAPVLAGRLDEEALPASWRLRRGRGVVTWKNSDTVGLFLRRIGAGGALLELEARQVSRALRGDLNRVLNAESANLQRAVGAAGRQIAAISELEGDGRLAAQPYLVRIVAEARRETPEATLAELAERLDLHRSAVQRALERVERLALHPDEGVGRRTRARRALSVIRTMRPVIVAANWKMNTTPADAGELALTIAGRTREAGVVRVICPPFVCLAAVRDALAGAGEAVGIGAQDVHHEAAGAYTGDISASMLVGLATWVIVGHSERRRDHGETDAQISGKIRRALEAGLRPILCVGEQLAQREAGDAEPVVSTQLAGALDGHDPDALRDAGLVIAYEPVWAIGTGRNARGADAAAMAAAIRAAVRSAGWGAAAADDLPVLYGGSVTAANIAEFLAEPSIDGALVGGASLKPDEMAGIVARAGVTADARRSETAVS